MSQEHFADSAKTLFFIMDIATAKAKPLLGQGYHTHTQKRPSTQPITWQHDINLSH